MAIPLITASFVQMAYNMTDMIWLGRLGSEQVAAVGVAGFFTWLGNALAFIPKIGAEVTIAQSLGARQPRRARLYANQAVLLSVILATLFALFIWLAAGWLVGLFRLESNVGNLAVVYLRIVAPGLFFAFNINTFSGLFNGQGNSKSPFKIISVGLICNMILDPLLIYGAAPIPALGTAGAAIATVLSQGVVFAIFIFRLRTKPGTLGRINPFVRFQGRLFYRVALLGLPASMQNALFSIFSMTLGALAAQWGHIGVAVQSIGAQIEAITWMTAAGFSTALAAYTGQNYGARNFERIRKGYRYTLKLAGGFSGVATILFLLFPESLFSVFVRDPVTIEAGGIYLRILALSQLFSATESVTAGAFNGCGRTTPPAIVGILLTGARIPLAFYLVTIPALGLNGIWWSITLSSVLKGVVLAAWYGRFQRTLESGSYHPASVLGRMNAIATRLWHQF